MKAGVKHLRARVTRLEGECENYLTRNAQLRMELDETAQKLRDTSARLTNIAAQAEGCFEARKREALEHEELRMLMDKMREDLKHAEHGAVVERARADALEWAFRTLAGAP